MNPIHVCVPVLKRYDLLGALCRSLQRSIVTPTCLWVIDNGNHPSHLRAVLNADVFPVRVAPVHPGSVAASWNWFIQHVPEDRVISNDDVEFGLDSLARLTAPKADLVWAAGEGFSCFCLRDSCVEKIGLFDETISPGYAYYEDDDYLQRLDGRGTRAPSAIAVDVQANIKHSRSSTLRVATERELAEHHRKFKIAQANYMRKWGLSTLEAKRA